MSLAQRPFVDRPIATQDDAITVAEQAAAAWGLPTPTLMRTGMNALFESGDVVIRVGHSTAPSAAAHELHCALSLQGIPVSVASDGLVADIDGYSVTGWERVTTVSSPPDWEAAGAAIARLHELPSTAIPDAYPLADPACFPWWDFAASLRSVADHLDAAARDGLVAAIEKHANWVTMIGASRVVCHGDVHPGNLLAHATGQMWIDWDLLSSAHPAWDHAMLITLADRWGGDPDVYRRFSAGYGCDFTEHPVGIAVSTLRNVAATLMRVKAGLHDERARREANRRLRFWRGEPDAPTWSAQ